LEWVSELGLPGWGLELVLDPLGLVLASVLALQVLGLALESGLQE
jgi:hypothetical protein